MNTDELIDELINAIINHGKASEEGKARLANKNYSIIKKIEDELKKDFPVYVKRLESLLEHDDDYVKMWVAADLLQVLNKRAEKVLMELSTKRWSGRLTAEIILQEWRKGNLPT